ncbi:MAG TPA: hypothetical protein VI011_01715 [Asanoa sp.]
MLGVVLNPAGVTSPRACRWTGRARWIVLVVGVASVAPRMSPFAPAVAAEPR